MTYDKALSLLLPRVNELNALLSGNDIGARWQLYPNLSERTFTLQLEGWDEIYQETYEMSESYTGGTWKVLDKLLDLIENTRKELGEQYD